MKTQDVLKIGGEHLNQLSGHVFDSIEIGKPVTTEAVVNLSRIISKLSPIVGNLIEFDTVAHLNEQKEFHPFGKWKRQDPGFPDAVFVGDVSPMPGFEIKAWFPLATEITARFKDSQNHFLDDQTHVCLLAWLPEHIMFGKPKIIDVCLVSGQSVAKARDIHYHNPPDYLVLEPEDTSERAAHLQQTNTIGHVLQKKSEEELAAARQIVESWGADGKVYQPTREYQALLRELTQKFTYREDTNYAKIDRIAHPEIEKFKKRVLNSKHTGVKISEWLQMLTGEIDLEKIEQAFSKKFGI